MGNRQRQTGAMRHGFQLQRQLLARRRGDEASTAVGVVLRLRSGLGMWGTVGELWGPLLDSNPVERKARGEFHLGRAECERKTLSVTTGPTQGLFGGRPDLVPRVKMYLVKSRFSPTRHSRQRLPPRMDPQEKLYFQYRIHAIYSA